MISPSEIRINNWYNYTDQKISVWKRIDAAMMASIFSDTGRHALNDFEGIPITEEILSAVGYAKGVEFNLALGGVKLQEIKYLHQLQNLHMDFTGIELEITPPFSSSPPLLKNSGHLQ